MIDPSDPRLTRLLAAAIVISTVGVVYASVTPNQRTDPYTELYIEGNGGNASDYPQNLSVGETGRLVVGISNHENRPMDYTLAFRLGNETLESRTLSLAKEEQRELNYSFTPDSPGQQRLQIDLYRDDDRASESDPYRTVYLWVSVRKR